MGVHYIKGQTIAIYEDTRSNKYKLRWYVKDYYHSQLSTHGCLHHSYDHLYNFASKVIERMGTINIGKTEPIREDCKYVTKSK